MKLPENVTNLLKAGTPGGVAITKSEIDEAKVQLTNGQLIDVARKLSDAFADGNVVASIAERVGPNAVPAPLNALADHAVGKLWLDGSINIKKASTSQQNSDAIWVLQRALVKIGVHHPQGKAVAALLQLPYGADRDLGQGTINALNEALKLAGKPGLATLTVNSTIGKDVAEAVDTLLKQTTKIVHPSTIQVPSGAVKKLVVYVGMGDHSPTEAKALANAMGSDYELRKIIDSKLGDDIIQHNGVSYDLKEDAGREKFASEAFQPPLTAEQKSKVLSALNAGAWGIADARDEIAEVALAMHEVETSNGTKTMPFFYISGHSGSNDIWGDHNGSFPMEALDALTSGFPKAASTIEAPFFAACNHLHERHITDECAKWFEKMRFAGGYCRYSPLGHLGGAAQAVAYFNACRKIMKGSHPGPLTPDLIKSEVNALKATAGSNTNHVFFYGKNKLENLACYDGKTELYYWRDGAGQPVQSKKLTVNRSIVEERLAAVEEMKPSFEQLLAGTHPSAELRTVEPGADTLAKRYYEACIKLGGAAGLFPEEKKLADDQGRLGLCARYYGKILEHFTSERSEIISSGNLQLAAVMQPKSAGEIAAPALKRKQLLDYIASVGSAIAALTQQNKPKDKAVAYHDELTRRLRDFNDIPQGWL